MAEEKNKIAILEEQMNEFKDTHNNITGLVEKIAGVQAKLQENEFKSFADAAGEIFSLASDAAMKLQAVMHDMELERNRLRNEAE
jgi:hypothetical protein